MPEPSGKDGLSKVQRFFQCLAIDKRKDKACIQKDLSQVEFEKQTDQTRCAEISYRQSATIRRFGAYKFGYDVDLEKKYTSTNKVLGHGAFGTVYQGISKQTGEMVAIKTIQKASLQTEMDRRDLRMEVDVLNRIGNGSLNCISLLDTFEDEEYIYLVMERAEGGTLLQRLVTRGHYSEAEAACVARFVLQTIAQCHAKNIIYRDVKLENFVYMTQDQESVLKAIDFGLAVHHPPGSPNLTDTTGSPFFMAPEVVRQNYSFECDLWSVGAMVYMLLTGKRPFTGNPALKGDGWIRSVLLDIVKKPVSFKTLEWRSVSKSAIDFVSRLLVKDPSERMTVRFALKHPWITSFSDKKLPHLPTIESGLKSSFNNSTIIARLQRFSTFDTIKKKALGLIIREHQEATDEGRVERSKSSHTSQLLFDFIDKSDDSVCLTRMFNEMDKTGKGTLSLQDAQAGLYDAGYDISSTELKKIWTSVASTSTSGEADISDFLTALLDWNALDTDISKNGGDVSELYKEAFQMFDTENKGYLEASDIARVLKKSGNSPDVKVLVSTMDKSQTGRITLKDFEEAMNGNKNDDLDIYDARIRRSTSDEEFVTKIGCSIVC